MPSVFDTAFLPRFTELCNVGCETRLATNSFGRDLNVNANGEVSANLIIALCVNCEKKIIVPVQLCVLSTGFVELSPNTSQVCANFPQLFPNQINGSDEDVDADADDNNNCDQNCRPACPPPFTPGPCCPPPPGCCDPFPVIG